MKIEHDIFWGQKHIGCCKIFLSYHGISFHEIKTKYDIDSNLLTRWFYSRCVPSSRINYKAIIKIMAVPEYTNRWYDFICTACVLNYGRSLTDPFWLNPRQKYIYEIEIEESQLPNFEVEPKEYDQVTYQKNDYSQFVGNILFDERTVVNLSEINYNSPDFATSGDLNKRWVRVNSVDWLEKRSEWLSEEELRKQYKIKEETLRELSRNGTITPSIELIPYGWRTTCLCKKESDALLSNEQLLGIFQTRSKNELMILLANMFEADIDRSVYNAGNKGILIRDHILYGASW